MSIKNAKDSLFCNIFNLHTRYCTECSDSKRAIIGNLYSFDIDSIIPCSSIWNLILGSIEKWLARCVYTAPYPLYDLWSCLISLLFMIKIKKTFIQYSRGNVIQNAGALYNEQ